MLTGIIAGRFQVFHNGHLRYLRTAREYCEHLIIGITNPDPRSIRETPLARHRSESASNPFTYYERMKMIKYVCKAEKMPEDTYEIVPFPLDVPEYIKFYIPNNSLVMITVHDQWSLEKKKRIEEQGYEVKVIINEYNMEKLSSTKIRRLIVEGQEYSQYVPPVVYQYMHKNSLDERIKIAGCK